MKNLPRSTAAPIIEKMVLANELIRIIRKRTVAQLELDNKFIEVTFLLQEVFYELKPLFSDKKDDMMFLIIAGNTSSSIAGLIDDKSADISHVREASAGISYNLEKFSSIFELMIVNNPIIRTEKTSFKSWEDGLVAARNKFNSEEIEIVKDDSKHIKQKSAIAKGSIKYLNLLPNSKNSSKSYVRLKLPVAAIGSWMHTKYFIHMGLRISDIGGYPIIHDQFILGVNTTKLRNTNETLGKNSRIEAKNYVYELIKNRKKKYIVIGDGIRYNKKETGFMYFWLMEEDDFNVYTQKGSRTFGDTWGLAF